MPPAAGRAQTPAALWHLDEGSGQLVADASGNGNAGVLGMATAVEPQDPLWIPGRLGGALRFDGTLDQYVLVHPGPELRPQRLTVRAWVRREGTPGRWRYIVSMGGTACDRSAYGLYSGDAGGLAFYVSDDTRYVLSPAVPPAGVWDGQWHEVAGSFDGARVRLYLDGAEVGSGTPTSLQVFYALPVQSLYLGSYRAGCDLPFTGDIDEVGVWGAALTPAQIADQHQVVASQPPPAATLPPVSGPPVSGPPASGNGPSSPTSGAPTLVPCLKVGVSTATVRLGRRVMLTVVVRRGARPAAHVRVRLRGLGIRIARVTDRTGRVRVALRVVRRTKLAVTVEGQPQRCAGAVVTAR